jgi:hypothetical protein
MTKTSAEDIDSPNPKPTHPIDPGASTETYISAFVAVVEVVIGIANATHTPEEESHASCPLTAFTTIPPHQQPPSTKKGGKIRNAIILTIVHENNISPAR